MRWKSRAFRCISLSVLGLAGLAAPPVASAQSVWVAQPTISIAPANPRAGEGPINLFLSGGGGLGSVGQISVSGNRIDAQAAVAAMCPTPAWLASKELPELGEGTYTIYAMQDDYPLGNLTFHVAPPARSMALQALRFRVSLSRAGGGGDPQPANAVKLTDQSGYFWFFDGDNVEVTLKIVDGRALNGHFWVFAASMTDLPFTLKIEDLSPACTAGPSGSAPAGCVRTWSTASQNQNILDVEAFGS